MRHFASHLRHEVSKLGGMSTHPKVESRWLSLSVFEQLSKQAFAFKRKRRFSHVSELIKPVTVLRKVYVGFGQPDAALGPPSCAWVCLHGTEGQEC